MIRFENSVRNFGNGNFAYAEWRDLGTVDLRSVIGNFDFTV